MSDNLFNSQEGMETINSQAVYNFEKDGEPVVKRRRTFNDITSSVQNTRTSTPLHTPDKSGHSENGLESPVYETLGTAGPISPVTTPVTSRPAVRPQYELWSKEDLINEVNVHVCSKSMKPCIDMSFIYKTQSHSVPLPFYKKQTITLCLK